MTSWRAGAYLVSNVIHRALTYSGMFLAGLGS
jgi:hypothetical protein